MRARTVLSRRRRVLHTALASSIAALLASTAWHSAAASVVSAARDADIAEVRKLIAAGSDVNASEADGTSALLWAAPASAMAQPDSGIVAIDHWRRLGDTTLSRLVDQALEANQEIRLADARVRGARAFRLAAGLDLAPTVTFAAGYTRQRLPRSLASAGPGTFPDQDIWDGGVNGSWEVDVFGRLLDFEGALTRALRCNDTGNVLGFASRLDAARICHSSCHA